MQRKNIILVGVLFSAIAVGAGMFVASTSSTGGVAFSPAEATPQATSGTPPTAVPSAPTVPAAAKPTATASIPEPSASAEPAATAAPTASIAEAPTAPAPTATAAEPRFVEYTVQRGDLLLAIAQRYGVTVKDILAHNDIPNPDSLRVSQVLRIPQP